MARNNKNSKINEPKITHKILASIFRNKAARNAIEHRWRGQWTRALLMMARGRMKPIWRRRWKTKDDRTLYLIPRVRVFDSPEGGYDYDLNRIWLVFFFVYYDNRFRCLFIRREGRRRRKKSTCWQEERAGGRPCWRCQELVATSAATEMYGGGTKKCASPE